MKPTFHRDGTITYGAVYEQSWIRRARTVPDREFAAMNDSERARATSHLRARDGASSTAQEGT